MGMYRRDVLGVLGGITITGLAGCSMLDGNSKDDSNDGVVFSESFETDGLPETVRDESQSGGTVALQTDIVSSGSSSLGMSSSPGSDTKALVRTSQTFDGARRFAVDVYKRRDDVHRAKVDMKVSRDSGTFLRLFESGLCGSDGGGCFVEKVGGTTLSRGHFADPLPTGEWSTFAIEIRTDGSLAFQLGGETTVYEPELSWRDESVRVSLQTNVWQSADPGIVETRYDDLRVERL